MVRPTPVNEADVVAEWLGPLPLAKITRKYNISHNRVKRIVQAALGELPARKNIVYEERHLDDTYDRVLALAKRGLSYAEIGKEMHMTTGQIAGLVHRLRKKGHPIERPSRGMYVRPPRPPKPKRPPQYKPKPRIIPIIPVDPTELGIEYLPLVDCVDNLEEHHCRWPIGDPQRVDFGFCGKRKWGTSPYCARHTSDARAPEQPKPVVLRQTRPWLVRA